MEKTVSAVLVAAGSSTRMGFDKLSFDLGGETVLHRSIRAFAQCPQVTELVLVAGKNRDFVAQQAADCPKPVQIVAGGATRAESAKNGVLAAHGELVAVHDAARPFVSASVITAALEAAARDARYAFLRSLNGKIATAHTADDNAETVIMRMIRGTGLKGLGAIAPVSGNVIRPMLLINRQEVEKFLLAWGLPHREDSSNASDAFLRNRIRHTVMPLLKSENPRLAENLSLMALRLREDEDFLAAQSDFPTLPGVQTLRAMPKAQRSRCIERFLKDSGVREPEDSHISAVEGLLFSDKPSARVNLPGGVTVSREYDRLEAWTHKPRPEPVALTCPGETVYGDYRVTCTPADKIVNTPDTFTVCPVGTLTLRPRESGDVIRLSGGTKSLKKLFIDRKIPAAMRERIPVLCDEQGILGVYSIGVHADRAAGELPAVTVHFDVDIPESSDD